MTLLSVLGPALIGLVTGALAFPLIAYLGIRFNLKNLRTLYAHIPQDAAFYRAFAWTGGVMGAAYGAEMPILDSLGMKDPWYGLIMIATGMLIFLPFVGFLKRHSRKQIPRKP